MKSTQDTIAELNTLLRYCIDGEYGYKAAAQNIKSDSWKSFFTLAGERRARFVHELESKVVTMGGTPDNECSLSGAFHRSWIDIRSSYLSGNEKGILNECKRGDAAAKEKYDEILSDGELPYGLRQLILNQYEEISKVHEHIVAALENYGSFEGEWQLDKI